MLKTRAQVRSESAAKGWRSRKRMAAMRGVKPTPAMIARARELQVVEELLHPLREHAEANCADHVRDPEITRRELEGYLRGINDCIYTINQEWARLLNPSVSTTKVTDPISLNTETPYLGAGRRGE